MISAWLFALSGTLLSFGLGFFLGFDWVQVLKSILASNAAGMGCLIMVTFGHENKWFKKTIIPNVTATWLVFAGQFFLSLYLLTEVVHGFKNFLIMTLPLIFSTGFTILVFGPFRDALMRKNQARRR